MFTLSFTRSRWNNNFVTKGRNAEGSDSRISIFDREGTFSLQRKGEGCAFSLTLDDASSEDVARNSSR